MLKRQITVFSALILLITFLQPALGNRSTDIGAKWYKNGRDVLKNFRNMYQPHVICELGEEYPFKMWFFGWSAEDCNPGYSGCDAIFHARAKNLDDWEVYAGDGKWDATMNPKLWVPVLAAQNLFFDSWHNGDPSVVRKDGSYYMVYSSTGFDRDRILPYQPGDTDLDLYCITGATSPDGIHWTRSKLPLLINAADIGVHGKGEMGEIIGGMYARPSLMFDEGKWKCWFDYWAGSAGGVAMGYAECPADSFMKMSAWRVVRAGANPVMGEWPNPDVIKVGSKYYSYSDAGSYDKHPWTRRHICEAVSDDGINWKVLGHIPPESDAPATHVPEALVIKENGRKKIIVFYACQIGGEPYDYRYNRIRYMWRYE